MVSFLLTLWRFAKSLVRSLADEEFRALFILVVVLLVSGTVFYSFVEGWGVIDSLYFSVITLTTIGYGDLYPSNALSKVFTILYVLMGAGALVFFIQKLAENAVIRKSELKARSESGGKGGQSRRRVKGSGQSLGGGAKVEKD